MATSAASPRTFGQWLRDNGGWLAVAVAILALLATSYFSLRQISLSRLSLQNSLIYTMMKDEIDVGLEFQAGRAPPDKVFAVMQAVFTQHTLGSVPDPAWELFRKDFCAIMKVEKLRREWQDFPKPYFTPSFRTFMGRLVDPQFPECRDTQ
jgi:hypothetical protein